MTKPTFNARRWHNWTSIALAIPLFIVAITSLFMAHEKTLQLQSVAWGRQTPEIRSVLYGPQGLRILASKDDVYAWVGGRLEPISVLQGMEARFIELLPDSSILVAGKGGLWRQQSGRHWQQIYQGDIHGLQVLSEDHWLIVDKDAGILASSDQGRNWQQDREISRLVAALPASPYNLEKLVHDLHTGKALFGKQGEWIWIDVLALVLGFLCLTGAWLWWKAQRNKQNGF